MQNIETLINKLRQKGYKITPQRRAIIELLVKDDSHPTAEDIYRRILTIMPDISRTTVYNTLKELVALGELSEVENICEDGIRYDTHVDSHHHLFCMRCHALVDINQQVSIPTPSADETSGYQIVRSQVTYYGYCPDCQTVLGSYPMPDSVGSVKSRIGGS